MVAANIDRVLVIFDRLKTCAISERTRMIDRIYISIKKCAPSMGRENANGYDFILKLNRFNRAIASKGQRYREARGDRNLYLPLKTSLSTFFANDVIKGNIRIAEFVKFSRTISLYDPI